MIITQNIPSYLVGSVVNLVTHCASIYVSSSEPVAMTEGLVTAQEDVEMANTVFSDVEDYSR